jgi:hypothetical protein
MEGNKMSYNDEAQPGGLITWKGISIIIVMVIVISFSSIFIWNPMVDGTKRYATYTGVLVELDIDCSQCCHPSSGFSMNTSGGVVHELIGDCDDHLEHIVHVGNVYTIRLEPYAESYAISKHFGEPTSFWSVKIDWIKDSNGNVIWGNEWI